MKQMKAYLMTGLVALCAIMTSCSSDSRDSIIGIDYVPYDGNATGYYGTWSIGEQVIDHAYVWDCDTALRLGHTPLLEYIKPLVQEGELRAELISTIWHADYTLPIEQTGFSDNSTYFRIPQKNFRLFAEYGGEEHEIVVTTSPNNSTMVKNQGGKSLNILLRLTEIRIDGVLQKVFDPEETLTYTSTRTVD